ncbi:MAG: hypothetical protein ACXAC2_18555 [Candidatus Kariarchaeaceae archaeon]
MVDHEYDSKPDLIFMKTQPYIRPIDCTDDENSTIANRSIEQVKSDFKIHDLSDKFLLKNIDTLSLQINQHPSYHEIQALKSQDILEKIALYNLDPTIRTLALMKITNLQVIKRIVLDKPPPPLLSFQDYLLIHGHDGFKDDEYDELYYQYHDMADYISSKAEIDPQIKGHYLHRWYIRYYSFLISAFSLLPTAKRKMVLLEKRYKYMFDQLLHFYHLATHVLETVEEDALIYEFAVNSILNTQPEDRREDLSEAKYSLIEHIILKVDQEYKEKLLSIPWNDPILKVSQKDFMWYTDNQELLFEIAKKFVHTKDHGGASLGALKKLTDMSTLLEFQEYIEKLDSLPDSDREIWIENVELVIRELRYRIDHRRSLGL